MIHAKQGRRGTAPAVVTLAGLAVLAFNPPAPSGTWAAIATGEQGELLEVRFGFPSYRACRAAESSLAIGKPIAATYCERESV